MELLSDMTVESPLPFPILLAFDNVESPLPFPILLAFDNVPVPLEVPAEMDRPMGEKPEPGRGLA